MSDKAWKALERRLCRALRGERTPLSGGSSRHTRGDCIFTSEYVEIKHRKKIPFLKDFKEAEENAKKEGKPCLFIIHEKGSHKNIVFMDFDYYLEVKNGKQQRMVANQREVP